MDAPQRACWLFLLLILVCAGCQTTPWPLNLTLPGPEETDGDTKTPAASDVQTSKETAEKPPSKPTAEKLPIAGLSDERWVLNVRPMVPGIDDPLVRWHHPALDSAIAAASRRGNVESCLTHENPIVAANAAIVLARSQTGTPVAELVAASRNEDLRLPVRQAAIESLGILSNEDSRDAILGLLSQETNSEAVALSAIPELHSELLYARSQHALPQEDSRFTTALKHPSKVVRTEAASVWARSKIPAADLTPIELLDLASDSDTRVRVAAIRAIAVNRPTRAVEYLSKATHDFDLNVRLTAIAGLGLVGGPQAQALLDKMRQDPSEVARAAVVGAFVAMGADQAVLTAASDRSARVRQAVAQSIADLKSDANQVSQEAQSLALELVHDASSEVQRQAVESMRDLPLEQAGPILMVAIEEGTYSTRKNAVAQLAERWPPAKEFYVDASADRRAEQLKSLKMQWEGQFGSLERTLVKAAVKEAVHVAGLSDVQIQLVRNYLRELSDPDLPVEIRDRAVRELKGFGPGLVAALNLWNQEDIRRLPEELYSLVLPEISPVFANLRRIASAEIRERRLALSELANEFKESGLSSLALIRLAEVVQAETDPIIWQSVLILIANDPRQVATQLAYIAIANSSSDVRRRACEYLKKHSSTDHCEVLQSLLADENTTVVIAAIRAIGAAGVQNPQPLIELLNSRDRQLRMEAAVALAKSQFEAGAAALERLSLETDLEVRLAVAAAMGELEDKVFLPSLIRMLEDHRDVQVAAMASLKKIARCDVIQDGELSVLPEEKIRRWKRWHENELTKSQH